MRLAFGMRLPVTPQAQHGSSAAPRHFTSQSEHCIETQRWSRTRLPRRAVVVLVLMRAA